MADFWGVPALPEKPGLSAVELFEALRRGEVKALWIACTNPAQSLPQQARVREALARAEFVVLQEAYRNTETADCADLLLPAATWGEKEGTLTNSERRISRVHRAVPPPGEARPDWVIARDFALGLGRQLGRAEAARLFSYTQPEQIFREHAATTRGRDLDITGLDYALLEARGPQQWPFPAGAAQGAVRLYGDRRFATPDGRARFVALRPALTAETTDAHFPLHLNSGRLRDQWHGMSRSGKAAQLCNHEDTARLRMHPADMARHGLAEDNLARLIGRRGAVVLPVAADEGQRPGEVFVAMHYGRRHLSHSGVNELMPGALDPLSKQPELKHAAVRVEKAALPWQALVVRGEARAGEALEWLERLQAFLPRFEYAALGLAGREHAAVVLRLAAAAPVADAVLDEIDAVLALSEARCLSYHDPRRGVRKKALLADGLLAGFHLAGETAAGAWLQEFVVARRPAAGIRRWLFAPLAAPPEGARPGGRIVCSCHNVAESDIVRRIAAGDDLAALQGGLRCGTACGSCAPEIKRLLQSARSAA